MTTNLGCSTSEQSGLRIFFVYDPAEPPPTLDQIKALYALTVYEHGPAAGNLTKSAPLIGVSRHTMRGLVRDGQRMCTKQKEDGCSA